MKSNQSLDPDLQTVLDELTTYHEGRLHDVQSRRARKGIALVNDGQYDLMRLLAAQQNDRVSQQAPYEQACSDRIAAQVGRPPRPGYAFVPIPAKRDVQVANTGGYLVQTDVGAGGLFVHYLDSFFPFQRLGIQRLTLQRPTTIPGLSGTVTAGWLADESSMLTESQLILVISNSTPKTVGAYLEASRQLLKQTSPAGQSFLMQAGARAVVGELSRALIVGSGTGGQIRGVANTPGVGSVPGGSANYAKVLDMIEVPEAANAIVTPEATGFVMRANIAKLNRTRELSTGGGTMMVRNELAGYPAVVSQGASPNTMTFGDWSQLVLLEYNTLEIGTDPYGANSALFKSGMVGIRFLWSVDAVVLNPSSFVVSGALS